MNGWLLSVTILSKVSIAVEVNPIGSITSFSISKLYLTLTLVEVPIPTDLFGTTLNVILSSGCKLCAVDTDTTQSFFWTTHIILFLVGSREYS